MKETDEQRTIIYGNIYYTKTKNMRVKGNDTINTRTKERRKTNGG